MLAAPFIFVFGLHLIDPCKPSLFGYFLLRQCSCLHIDIDSYVTASKILGFATHALLLLINFYFLTLGIRACCFCIAGVQILCQLSLRDYIRSLWRQTFSQPAFNSMSPRIILYKFFAMYREIQVMGCLNNIIQKKVLLYYIIISTSVLSLTTFTTVRMFSQHSKNSMQIGVLLTFMIGVNAFMTLFVHMTGMVAIYNDSIKLISNLKRCLNLYMGGGEGPGKGRLSLLDLKWVRKSQKACAPIKIKFGGCNFLEKGTPLVSLNFANNLAINLLLLV